MFDQDAISRVARDLKIDESEVVKGAKIGQVYERHARENKRLRKEKAHKIAAQRAIDDLEKKHPDRCFCDARGLVERDWMNLGEPAGYEDWVETTYYGAQTWTTYKQAYYLCSRCHKKLFVLPAMA